MLKKLIVLVVLGYNGAYAIDQAFAQYLQAQGFGKTAAEIMGNVNVVNAKGETPIIFVAGHFGDNPRVRVAIDALKKSGADVNYINPQTRQSALIVALRKESPNWTTAEALLDVGANPNVADENGITPLMIAANKDVYWMSPDSNSLVYKLLQKGATKGAKDAKGYIAADYAAEKNKAQLGAGSQRTLPLPPISIKSEASKSTAPSARPISLKPTARPAKAISREHQQAFLIGAIIEHDAKLVEQLLEAGVSANFSISPLELTTRLESIVSTSESKQSYKKIISLLSQKK